MCSQRALGCCGSRAGRLTRWRQPEPVGRGRAVGGTAARRVSADLGPGLVRLRPRFAELAAALRGQSPAGARAPRDARRSQRAGDGTRRMRPSPPGWVLDEVAGWAACPQELVEIVALDLDDGRRGRRDRGALAEGVVGAVPVNRPPCATGFYSPSRTKRLSRTGDRVQVCATSGVMVGARAPHRLAGASWRTR